MNKTIERIMKILFLKGLVSPSDKASKLSTQGLSGEVYEITSKTKSFILKFYRRGDAHKAFKEMKIYQVLSRLGIPVPKVYFADTEGKIAKKPFLLIQKLEGESFASLLKRGKGREFVESFAASLHKLHSAQLSNLDLKLKRKSLIDELYELKNIAAVFLALSMSPIVFHRVYKTLSEVLTRPLKGNPPALLHGDCGPDNIIYRNGVVYLIDFEEAYVGDPAFDVGYAYHSIKFSVPHEPVLADHFVETYESLHGKLRNLKLYKRLAALKLAIFLTFLSNINLLSIMLLGLKRAVDFLAFRKQLSMFAKYCLEYAEKGRAELNLN